MRLSNRDDYFLEASIARLDRLSNLLKGAARLFRLTWPTFYYADKLSDFSMILSVFCQIKK